MQDIDLLPNGVFIINSESHITAVNAFVCTLLGYEADELVGKRIDRLLTMASRIYYQTHIYPLVTLQRAANELYLNMQTQQQDRIPVLLNIVCREQNGASAFYCSFIPVLQRRQFEQELIQARRVAEDALLRNDELTQLQQELEQHQTDLDRQLTHMRHRNDELEQFSKIISHDLQEPLRKITFFADLLSQQRPGASGMMTSRALAGIEKSALRLRQLVGDLQFYFALTNDPPTAVKSVSLATLVPQIALEFDADKLTITMDNLPAVLGNEPELTNLFRQLLDNAVKFRQPGSSAVVHVYGTVVSMNSFRNLPHKYRYARYARIIVADAGIGFNNRYRDDVFRILQKLDPHTSGIGLGLAIAKKIVERHDGQISAESTESDGTRVTVLLPMG